MRYQLDKNGKKRFAHIKPRFVEWHLEFPFGEVMVYALWYDSEKRIKYRTQFSIN
jgi:hypothetical protein